MIIKGNAYMNAPLNKANGVSNQNADQNAFPVMFHKSGVKYNPLGLTSVASVMFLCDTSVIKKTRVTTNVCLNIFLIRIILAF